MFVEIHKLGMFSIALKKTDFFFQWKWSEVRIQKKLGLQILYWTLKFLTVWSPKKVIGLVKFPVSLSVNSLFSMWLIRGIVGRFCFSSLESFQSWCEMKVKILCYNSFHNIYRHWKHSHHLHRFIHHTSDGTLPFIAKIFLFYKFFHLFLFLFDFLYYNFIKKLFCFNFGIFFPFSVHLFLFFFIISHSLHTPFSIKIERCPRFPNAMRLLDLLIIIT